MQIYLRKTLKFFVIFFKSISHWSICRFMRIYLKLNGVNIGKNFDTQSWFYCRKHPQAKISIGNNFKIQNKLNENLAGITHRSVLCASLPTANLVIGNNVGISGAIIYCTTEIIIEDYVLLGAGVKIYDTDFHPLDAETRRTEDKGTVQKAPVKICQDVWVGAEAVILKGVTIGPRSIVAARAVVTKNVPADCIVGGIPAQIIAKSNQ